MTKFISYYARRNNLLAVLVLAFGTSIFLIPSANAVYANATVVCATTDGQQRSFQIGWDNSNIFFADKGYIPRLFCEGGYAAPYRVYISDTLNNSSLGYFQGIVPTPVETPSTQSDTSTATAETQTATADTNTATSDTSTSSSDTTTTTSQQETPTATQQPTDSSTPTSDTPTVSPVDGSTATSQQGNPLPEPAPPAVPVVEPTPVEEPAVVPVEEPIVPEPEPEPEVIVPVEDLPEEQIVPEEVIPPEETKDDIVVLDNGVQLTQEQAVAVALLQDPAALLQELFTNPAEAFAALGQVGADMSPEVREQSKKVVISAVIAGNIATQAAATAGAVAAYRRKQ